MDQDDWIADILRKGYGFHIVSCAEGMVQMAYGCIDRIWYDQDQEESE